MPMTLRIILWCMVGILSLWLMIIAFVSIILLIINKQIKRNYDGINIILAQKYDISVVYAKFLIDSNVDIPNSIKEELNIAPKPNFSLFNTFERKKIGIRLNEIIDELNKISGSIEIEDQKRLNTLKNSMSDVEKQYRHKILNYNTSVWNYNYWVGFLPFQPISKLLKIKKKKEMIINSQEDNQ